MINLLNEIKSNANLVYGTNKYTFDNYKFSASKETNVLTLTTFFYSKRKDLLYKIDTTISKLSNKKFIDDYLSDYLKEIKSLDSNFNSRFIKVFNEIKNLNKSVYIYTVDFYTKHTSTKHFSIHKNYERKSEIHDLVYEFGGIKYLVENTLVFCIKRYIKDDYYVISYYAPSDESFRINKKGNNKRLSVYEKIIRTLDKSLLSNCIGTIVNFEFNFIISN